MAEITDDKIVDEVVRTLSGRFRGLSAEFLAARTRQVLSTFKGVTIRDFLPVLVERRVIQELRSEPS